MATMNYPARSRRRTPWKGLTARAVRKRETHQQILQSAGRIARREGLRAASVPRVMRGAGLTVGGFYAHFPSKTAMDAELVRAMLGELPGRWLRGLEDSAGLEWVERAVARYLSVAHRDDPDGCAYPAVLSEVSSSAPEVRQAFAEALELRVRAFSTHAPALPGMTARARAIATIATTIGGLLLARSTRGAPISVEVLNACRSLLLPESQTSPAIKRRNARV
jgi:TetR/AcrR family transcriptional regulator, transcriptional repressor for nem operon